MNSVDMILIAVVFLLIIIIIAIRYDFNRRVFYFLKSKILKILKCWINVKIVNGYINDKSKFWIESGILFSYNKIPNSHFFDKIEDVLIEYNKFIKENNKEIIKK